MSSELTDDLGGQGGQWVYFESRPKEMRYLSEKEGRPVYEDRDYLVVHQAGGKTVFVTEATEEHRRRYPREWAAYQAGRQRAVVGTPLEEWPQLSRSQVASLKALAIMSVEQLAELPDSGLSRIGIGGLELRERAKRWLASAKNSIVVERLRDEVTRLRGELSRVRRQKAVEPVRVAEAAEAAEAVHDSSGA